jgi:magnesium-transporting ATPase (P-type)
VLECNSQDEAIERIRVISGDLENGRFSLCLNGVTLSHIMCSKVTEALFFELTKKFLSVLCCRISAKQKGDVVKMVKQQTSAVCLAIGDGANDVR